MRNKKDPEKTCSVKNGRVVMIPCEYSDITDKMSARLERMEYKER